MRLRDLGAGLPALLMTIAVVPVLFVFRPNDNELLTSYQEEMQDAYAESAKITEVDAKKQLLDRALFFSRCLTQLRPLDKSFRYNLAMLYAGLGDEDRGTAIMSELAPRDSVGFGPAHYSLARQILMRPLSPDDFNTAVAHLESASKSNDVDRNEVYRQLGELYFQAYLMQESGGLIPKSLSANELIERAKKNFMEYRGNEVQPKLRLSTLLALQGNYESARKSVRDLVAELKLKIDVNPTDVQTRVELARVLASAMELTEAADVLQMGRIRKPDVRLDQELSNVYFAQAMEFQRRMPSAPELPYQALRASFEANPGNGMVVARLLQALLGTPKEAELARKMLADLPPKFEQNGTVRFLLGYDAERRQLPQIAEQQYGLARKSNDALAPAVIADVALAVIDRKYVALPAAVGAQLSDAALRIWPNHPDLLFIRGRTNFQSQRFAEAVSELNKAVAAKKNDVTLTVRLADDVRLHATLGSAYAKIGQRNNAEAHLALARAAAARREPLK
ncbi:MAG: hypothetical protein C0483_16375 [Pirellula sp.]|nr:hypothetical protein [Pirellula sp.]